MLARTLLISLLIVAPAGAQIDPRAIATDVAVGRVDAFRTPLGLSDAGAALTLDPFEAVAVTWRSDPRIGTEPVVRVRVSADGNRWSDWRTLAIDDDVTRADEGRYASGIAHFGAANRYLQLSIDRSAEGLTVTAFPEPSTRRNAVQAASIGTGALQIRSRVDWGCPDGETTTHGTPAYTTVTHAILHHTAGGNDLPNWDAEVRNIWYYHVFTNGWADIGYNFLIDPNGVIYEGRAGGDGVLGAHFSCINGGTVGIALLGTYSTADPTPAAVASVEALLRELCNRWKIDPSAVALHVASGTTIPTIVGHRDGNALPRSCTVTECPGGRFWTLLPAIRTSADCTPAIELPPGSITIATGRSTTLSVAATGPGLAYQWYAGAAGSTSSPIEGATSASVKVSPAAPAQYWVRVSNNCGSVDSAAATVNVASAAKRRSARHW